MITPQAEGTEVSCSLKGENMFAFNFNKTFTIAILFTFATHAQAHETIIGGSNVFSSDPIASTTVALYFSSASPRQTAEFSGEGSICTGSILDSGTILTAAHCVANFSSGVVVFNTDIKNHTPANTRQISSVKVYAKLTNSNMSAEQQDVATVSFLGGLPSGFHAVQYLPRTSLVNLLQPGASIILAGYGVTTYNPANPIASSSTAGVLRKVTTKIEKAGKYNLWVGFVGKTACHGDSGGPAFINYQGTLYLVGVTSRSTRPTGDCNGDSIYTQFTGLNSFQSQF